MCVLFRSPHASFKKSHNLMMYLLRKSQYTTTARPWYQNMRTSFWRQTIEFSFPNSQACVLEISMPRERNVTPSCRRKNQDSTDRRTLNDFRKHGKEWSKVQGCPNKQKMWVLKFSLTKFWQLNLCCMSYLQMCATNSKVQALSHIGNTQFVERLVHLRLWTAVFICRVGGRHQETT